MASNEVKEGSERWSNGSLGEVSFRSVDYEDVRDEGKGELASKAGPP